MELLAEQLQAGDGAGAWGQGGEVGQQSWKGAARSQRPSSSGPRPPEGPGEGGQRKEQRGTERCHEALSSCRPRQAQPAVCFCSICSQLLMPDALSLVPATPLLLMSLMGLTQDGLK